MAMTETRDESAEMNKVFRDYAWKYFALHADQRLKTFQFFITLATALIGGTLIFLRYDESHHKWIAVLGFLLCFLAFVFWKLDHRTSALVKNGENALKFLDARSDLPDAQGEPHPLAIFARDDYFTHW
jgi:hypothetical protein